MHTRSLARARMRTYDEWKADDGTDSEPGPTAAESLRIKTWLTSTAQCPTCTGCGALFGPFRTCPTCNGAKRLSKETPR